MKNKKKILIIGGLGFIGHNLAIYLKKFGYKLKIIDSLLINNILALKKNPLEYPNPKIAKKFLLDRLKLVKKNNIIFDKLDARNYKRLTKSINKFSPDVVIHLAAVSHANKSNKNPYTTFDHSLRTLENAIDAVRNKKVHFIYFSSSMVYGDFKKNIVSETDQLKPKGIYGSLKLAGELLVKAYKQAFNLNYTIIRPSALYGERCISRRVGQVFIENLIQKKKLVVNGSNKQRLDFTYIDDLMMGVKKVIENKNSLNQTFNLTYGHSESLATMMKILERNFKNFEITYEKKDKLMPKRGTLSINKAKKLIKYKPSFNLEKGYQRYINWYKIQKFKN